jgi:hypothetical protein
MKKVARKKRALAPWEVRTLRHEQAIDELRRDVAWLRREMQGQLELRRLIVVSYDAKVAVVKAERAIATFLLADEASRRASSGQPVVASHRVDEGSK